MPAIKSLEELKRIREEALQKKQMKATPGNVQVIVAMGTCGIAAGARDTIVQVVLGDQPKVVYGKVNAQVAEKIMKQHVQNGQPVKENIIQI
jgi:NADP-reducing hydrogenase subunit HndB